MPGTSFTVAFFLKGKNVKQSKASLRKSQLNKLYYAMEY